MRLQRICSKSDEHAQRVEGSIGEGGGVSLDDSDGSMNVPLITLVVSPMITR